MKKQFVNFWQFLNYVMRRKKYTIKRDDLNCQVVCSALCANHSPYISEAWLNRCLSDRLVSKTIYYSVSKARRLFIVVSFITDKAMKHWKNKPYSSVWICPFILSKQSSMNYQTFAWILYLANDCNCLVVMSLLFRLQYWARWITN